MRLTSVIERFESELLAREDLKLLPGARRALSAMKRCRHPDALQFLAHLHPQDRMPTRDSTSCVAGFWEIIEASM
jgi:hypothetical protein